MIKNNLKRLSLKEDSNGFTVIEIIVVILLIGILVTILLLTYNGISQRQRNNTRISDIKLIQSHLETYYAVSGFYPTLANMNNPAWIQKNLVGIDESVLIDPSSKSTVPMFTEISKVGEYMYNPTAADGTSQCNDKNVPCAKYTLSATLEGGAGVFMEKSLN